LVEGECIRRKPFDEDVAFLHPRTSKGGCPQDLSLWVDDFHLAIDRVRPTVAHQYDGVFAPRGLE